MLVGDDTNNPCGQKIKKPATAGFFETKTPIKLALRELRTSTRLAQTNLLTLNFTGVARNETSGT